MRILVHRNVRSNFGSNQSGIDFIACRGPSAKDSLHPGAIGTTLGLTRLVGPSPWPDASLPLHVRRRIHSRLRHNVIDYVAWTRSTSGALFLAGGDDTAILRNRASQSSREFFLDGNRAVSFMDMPQLPWILLVLSGVIYPAIFIAYRRRLNYKRLRNSPHLGSRKDLRGICQGF